MDLLDLDDDFLREFEENIKVVSEFFENIFDKDLEEGLWYLLSINYAPFFGLI